jgi:hypothetical protein
MVRDEVTRHDRYDPDCPLATTVHAFLFEASIHRDQLILGGQTKDRYLVYVLLSPASSCDTTSSSNSDVDAQAVLSSPRRIRVSESSIA